MLLERRTLRGSSAASGWARTALLCMLLPVVLAGATGGTRADEQFATTPLYSSAVLVDAGGGRVLSSRDARVIDGTRTLAEPGTSRIAHEQRAWLSEGTVPGQGGPNEDMVEKALLDLHVLSVAGSPPVAGWSSHWRYVWPRDSAFAAAALATTGHVDDAIDILRFLQNVQDADGRFHARYLPDGSGVPDSRGYQLDGTGWALWAAERVLAEVPENDRVGVLYELAPLLRRSTAALMLMTGDGSHLPPASPDYWEVSEATVTLGTAGPVLAGLEAAATLHEMAENRTLAQRTTAAADRMATVLESEFKPWGYPRHHRGGAVDAAVCFVVPPFVSTALSGAESAWRAAPAQMLRPAGGLAPGESWRSDGVSWTPETALFALTAAHNGDRSAAQGWLDWLDRHRTDHGSLPEKVLHDGSPAAVAPLAWTAATVVLSVAQLDELDSPRTLARP